MDIPRLIEFLMMCLLVIILVIMYVHLTHLIKDDGIKIQLLYKEMKENMSAAQRMGLAGLYVGTKPNMLMPSDKRDPGDASKRAPMIGNSRCNVDTTHWKKAGKVEVNKTTPAEVAKNIGVSVVEAVQNGAASAAAVTELKPNATIETTDETMTVDPVQNGIIEPAESPEGFTGVNSRISPNMTWMKRSDQRPVIAKV
jgi:hypothetical protein